MNNADKQYLELVDYVLANGRLKKNRTGIDTIGVFGQQLRFNLSEGFPLLTTKKVFFKGIVHELLWFLSGSTNIKYLVDNDVHIWDEWAFKRNQQEFQEFQKKWPNSIVQPVEYKTQSEFIEAVRKYMSPNGLGELGEGTYGGMWRKFPYSELDKFYNSETGFTEVGEKIGYVDQIQKVIDKLKTNPDDRRMIVSAWHPYWVEHCSLPPCHCLFQFHTEELTIEERNSYGINVMGQSFLDEKEMDEKGVPKRRLNCQLYQRSCDLAIGNPYNIASYALLTHMIAQVSNMVVGDFIHTFGDLHIYVPHIENLKIQRTREPYPLPTIQLNPEIKNIFDFKIEDIKLLNYQSHGKLAFEVAV